MPKVGYIAKDHGEPVLHVSVQTSALARAEYQCPLDGLTDLGLRCVDVDVMSSGEAPRLDAQGWLTISVANETGARAYRECLYEHRISVSALRVECPPDQELHAIAQDLQLIVQAADIVRAPVVCVEGPDLPQEALFSVVRTSAELAAGMRAGLCAVWPTSSQITNPLQWLDLDDAVAVGLSVELDALFDLAPSAEWAYDLLRALSPYVRCVVCRHVPGQERIRGPSSPRAHTLPDYARVASILGIAGYDGAFTAELPRGIGGEEARPLLVEQVQHLREISGEY